MANQSSSSSYPILCAPSIRITAIGAFVIVEMLYASSLLAIVGAGEQVCGTWACSEIIVLAILSLVKNYNFLWGIRGDRKEILVVILQEKTYIYDINSLDILDTIDTVPNFKGEVGIPFSAIYD
ncbi:hypothetical protein TEA_018462 [Camellia sinensis var. sinensis]|uniref:Uncharacterized protein n=1 Tax=Camellia sinensis var. sinensis TaxID=542762 RepID=A0A4S4CVC5_CAMSN|nr:hypothetical protein TEA_018462 [Camellia sinensis var. sinensis]